jgi:hypothetical protein
MWRHRARSRCLSLVSFDISAAAFRRIDALVRLTLRGADSGVVRKGKGVRQYHIDPHLLDESLRCRDTELSHTLNRIVAECYSSSRLSMLEHEKASMQICSAWINIAGPRHFHNWHTHTGAQASAVLFLNTPRVRNFQGSLQFRRSPRSLNVLSVVPRTGLLLVFPSYLEHRTLAIEHGTRRTLAFDFGTCTVGGPR